MQRYMEEVLTRRIAAKKKEDLRIQRMKTSSMNSIYQAFLLLDAATPILSASVLLCPLAGVRRPSNG
ncbi:hypothetical protein HKX48_003217 [Thoreauomyces humboldtii]|nr:hypothetical protein HKX48_003217 [Thoreauomyces humboldtii]